MCAVRKAQDLRYAVNDPKRRTNLAGEPRKVGEKLQTAGGRLWLTKCRVLMLRMAAVYAATRVSAALSESREATSGYHVWPTPLS